MPAKKDDDDPKPTRYLKLRLRGKCLERYLALHSQKVKTNPPLPWTPSAARLLERVVSERAMGWEPTKDVYRFLFGPPHRDRRRRKN
jgi:hypothetical protein